MVKFLLALDNGTLPQFNAIAVDGRVMAFACLLGILIAIALSFLPGLRSGRNLNVGLKSGARNQAIGRGERIRGGLVIGQIGLTLVLLTGAGLLMRSFFNVMHVAPGFDIESTMVMTLSLPTTISAAFGRRASTSSYDGRSARPQTAAAAPRGSVARIIARTRAATSGSRSMLRGASIFGNTSFAYPSIPSRSRRSRAASI